jgi:hypothetical protein
MTCVSWSPVIIIHHYMYLTDAWNQFILTTNRRDNERLHRTLLRGPQGTVGVSAILSPDIDQYHSNRFVIAVRHDIHQISNVIQTTVSDNRALLPIVHLRLSTAVHFV